MDGPLQGVRVFDMTHAGVGPWGTMILAAMGANVVKIETPQGDGIRNMRPRYNDLSAVYMHCNLGKKGIYLDLKSDEGKKVARGLLKEADIYAENMKWGTVQRLGFGYDDVSKLNPRIVYGNFPGWGSTGPLKDRGSADLTAQAFSGVVSTTGKRDGAGEFIRWYALHDFNASSFVTMTLLLGLLQRERAGHVPRLESAQVASSVAVQTSRIAEFLATGENVVPMGSANTATVPHRAFLCQDKRWLAVGVINDAQWRGLC
ncbi:MAG: CoA transferase, partial [Chloroflexi bacterium]|nr:CoA transferase [Chloroflexota bacterium]